MILEHVVLTADPYGPRDTMTLMHVCRYWRNVASETASRLSCIQLEGLNTFITRSKVSPLHILLSAWMIPVLVPAAVQALINQIGRVRVLRINLPETVDRAGLASIARMLHTPAPLLEEVSVSKTVATTATLPDAYEMKTDYDGVPRLRSMALHNLPFPYLPKGPTVLTRLVLSANVDTRCEEPLIMDLLGRCPLLESFYFRGMIFNRGNHIPDGHHTVVLPHLKSLEFYAFPARSVRRIIEKLALPRQTSVSLVNIRAYNGDQIPDIIPPFHSPTPLRFECLQGLKQLELSWQDHNMQFCAYRERDDTCGPALKIFWPRVSGIPSERYLVNWPIDGSTIETFVVRGRGDFPIGRGMWGTMLRCLPRLKTLRLYSLKFSSTLYFFADEFGNGSNGHPLGCPELETLELCDMPSETKFWVALGAAIVGSRSPRAGGSLRRIEVVDTRNPWGGANVSTITAAGFTVVSAGEIQGRVHWLGVGGLGAPVGVTKL
ncbi:hypothetical protein C8Q77DRAFT_1097136 [Trametes polyzona]|nr:hypothetical protein C8Q77DRAFT_1097136 [Trametes polyzona]